MRLSAILLVFVIGSVLGVSPGGKIGAAWPPEQRVATASGAAIPHAAGHVLARLKRNASSARALSEPATRVSGDWYEVAVAEGETAEQALERLRRNKAVEAAELDYIARIKPLGAVALPRTASPWFTPNDPGYTYQWNLSAIQAPDAWDRSRGAGVVVAVIDSGISQGGSDLDCQTFASPYNAITRQSGAGVVDDTYGHGTHVAGTIAQCTNNTLGVAGVAFDATLMPVKVCDSTGSCALSDVARGIDWARTHNADVINLSLGVDCAGEGNGGWPDCSESVVNDALEAAAAADIVIVAAAGNADESVVGFPANHPDVIAVGALDYGQRRASYSSYGSALDLSAPGGDTSADANDDGYADGILQETRGSLCNASSTFTYCFLQGTSMATPHVAGAAAVLRAVAPNASRQQIQAALQTSARDLGTAGFDTTYGYGALQLSAALQAIGSAPTATTTPRPTATTPRPTTTPRPSATPTTPVAQPGAACATPGSGSTCSYLPLFAR